MAESSIESAQSTPSNGSQQPQGLVLQSALAYQHAGRSVLPIAPGCKRPSIVEPTTGEIIDTPWKPYQTTPADEAQIRAWFPSDRLMGIGIACGPVSGTKLDGVPYGLEILDVDNEATLDALIEAANWQGHSDLLARLVHQRTPGGAGHFAYVCVQWAGNTKLAQRQEGVDAHGKPQIVTLIETRGEGGQAVVAPTPPGIHPDHPERGYVLVRGSWEDLPIITPEERQALWNLTRSFNAYVEPEQVYAPRGAGRPGASGNRPGDWLNRTADRDWWHTLLERHDWTLVQERRGIQYWCRPGKDAAKTWSATLGACGDYFYVFSSNASPFQPNKAYLPFAAHAILDYSGDFPTAARALIPQRFAAEWPEAAAVGVPLLERLCASPDVRLTLEALPKLAGLSREAWGATRRAVKNLLGDTIDLTALHAAWKKARRTAGASASPAPLHIGDLVWTLNGNGDMTNPQPWRITAIEPAPSGELYALFAEVPSGCPLSQCERVLQTPGGAQPQTVGEDGRPVIHITPAMPTVVDAAQSAILTLPNGPQVFQRARKVCFIARGVPSPKWLIRPPDLPVIMPTTAARLTELAATAAAWFKFDQRSDSWQPALPPAWVADTLASRGEWTFPVLEGIVSTPTLLPDGSILDRPGYDQETGLFVALDRAYPPVPLRPTFDDARSALGLLQQPFMDFLFDDTSPANFSATLAALLTVLCRYTIQGDVPLFAVTATTRRSGKGLLVDVISIIATGRTAPRWAQPRDRDGDEERKRMLAIGLAGDPLILIDNLTRPLGSEALDIALTCQGTFADRTLGTHQIKEAPMHAVFFATGNNITYKADTAPRVVPIALDPKMERPEERTGFQQDDLRAWVRNERPRLVTAALTLLRAYFTSACPAQSITPMGGFEAWSALVRQALVWAGEADPLAGQKTLALEHDTGGENLRSLLVSWEACYKDKAATLRHARQDIGLYAAQGAEPANTWDDLRDALGAFDPRYVGERFDTTVVGYALRSLQGRVLDGKRLGSEAQGSNTRQWRVLPL